MNLPYKGLVRITKLYGTPPPVGFSYSTGKHSGVDLVGKNDKKVYAINNGIVIRSSFDSKGWGNYVAIKQDDGYTVIYCHLKTRNLKVNQRVAAGTQVGVEGSTGQVTGSHLHLEIRKNYSDKYSTINPLDYLNVENKVGDLKQKEVVKVDNNTPNAWARDAWNWCKNKGLLDGTRPGDNITREEMAIVLERLFNLLNK